MSRDILNRHSVKVYTNTLEDGEAVEIEQINSTTQTRANVSFKTRTTEQTASSEDDLMLVADNATGKVLKYTTIRNVHNSLIWKDVDKAVGTGRNVSLVNTANNVVIGVDSNNNENNRKLLLIGESNQVALEVFKSSIFRDGDLIVNSDARLVIRSNTYDYIFSQNANLTANRTISIPLLSNDGTLMIDENNVGLKLANNIIKSSDSKELLNATSAGLVVVGNTTEELRLQSNSTGVKLMNNKLLDSAGVNLLSKLSTTLTLGDTSSTLILDSLATGVKIQKGLLFTDSNNNLISNLGNVTNVGYSTNTYTQISGTHVRLGSNKLYDSAGVNLLSKSGSTITIGSAGVTTNISGIFKMDSNIEFTNITAGSSKKILYTFSGSATSYDLLEITRDGTTDADSIIELGNTSHKLKLSSKSDAGILVDSSAGFKVSATARNLMKYTESLGSYDIELGNISDDLRLTGLDVVFSSISLGNPTQFLIANTSGVQLGSSNKQLTLRGSTANGIQIESSLRNESNRVILDYDTINTTNVFGSRVTDKATLNGTEIDVFSSGDIDFNTSASSPFDTYSVKIQSTGSIQFANSAGIAQSIKTRSNNNLIGINSANTIVEVGNSSQSTNIITGTGNEIKFFDGTTENLKIGSQGDLIFVDATTKGIVYTDSGVQKDMIKATSGTVNVGNTTDDVNIQGDAIKFADPTTERMKITDGFVQIGNIAGSNSPGTGYVLDITSGAGSNGDCKVAIRADTDNSVEGSTPSLELLQDGGATSSSMNMDINNNLNFTLTGSATLHDIVFFINDTEKMRIMKTGGIDVKEDLKCVDCDLTVDNDLIIDGDIYTQTNKKRMTLGEDNKYETAFYTGGSGDQRYKIQQDSNIVLYNSSNNAIRVVSYTIPSERDTKKDIEKMDSAKSLETVSQLIPCSFKYKEEEQIDDETHTGFIVDEIEPILPECIEKITGGAKERKLLSLDKIIPTLVSAVQQLTEKVTQLENIIEKNNLTVS